MSESTPHFAPIVVLLFLGAVLLSSVSLIALLCGAVRKSTRLATFGGVSLAVILAGYFVVLFSFSLSSREIVLPAGGWKYFCEIDCHIAYSIAGIEMTEPPRVEMKSAAEARKFVTVRVKSWFDPGTISPHRGDGPLTPNPRRMVLVDDQGHSYFPLSNRETTVRYDEIASAALTKPLRPGESYISNFVFDVPQQASGLRLLISEDDPETHFMIGHENSFLHKKIYLALNLAGSAAVAQPPFTQLCIWIITAGSWSYVLLVRSRSMANALCRTLIAVSVR